MVKQEQHWMSKDVEVIRWIHLARSLVLNWPTPVFFFYDYPTPYQKMIPCTSSEITPSQPLCCFAVSVITLINTIIMSTVLIELNFIIAKSFHTIGYIILHNQKLWKKCFHSGLKGKYQPINTSSVMPTENGHTGNY